MPARLHVLVALFASGLAASSLAPAREFTSADGSKTIEAEVVSVDPRVGTVTLRGLDSRIFDAKISAFSQEDRKFLAEFEPARSGFPFPTTPKKESLADQVKRLRDIAGSRSNFPKTADEILPLLGAGSHPALRRAAATAAGSIPSPELVSPLIGALPDRVIGGRAHDSLVRLTGQDFGKNPTGWDRWWEGNRGGFLPENLTLRQLATRRAKEDREKPEPDPDTASFYGREITGKDILFLLDVSGSMEGERLKRLQMELRSMVEHLPGDCAFAFIFFPHQVFPEEGLGKAATEFKRDAYKVIEDLEAGGGTPMGRAIDSAFDRLDRGDSIDTIYLLSDGEPSDRSPTGVRRLIARRNRAHYVVIHTVAIGEDSDLLQSISDDHEGNYIWSATRDGRPGAIK